MFDLFASDSPFKSWSRRRLCRSVLSAAGVTVLAAVAVAVSPSTVQAQYTTGDNADLADITSADCVTLNGYVNNILNIRTQGGNPTFDDGGPFEAGGISACERSTPDRPTARCWKFTAVCDATLFGQNFQVVSFESFVPDNPDDEPTGADNPPDDDLEIYESNKIIESMSFGRDVKFLGNLGPEIDRVTNGFDLEGGGSFTEGRGKRTSELDIAGQDVGIRITEIANLNDQNTPDCPEVGIETGVFPTTGRSEGGDAALLVDEIEAILASLLGIAVVEISHAEIYDFGHTGEALSALSVLGDGSTAECSVETGILEVRTDVDGSVVAVPHAVINSPGGFCGGGKCTSWGF